MKSDELDKKLDAESILRKIEVIANKDIDEECMMNRIRVFHIMTGGLLRDGISVTQLETFKHMDRENFKIDIAAVHNDNDIMIEEFRKNQCEVYKLPDRKNDLVKYFFALIKLLNRLKPDIVHVHGSSAIMSIDLLAAKLAGVKVRIAHSRNTKSDNKTLDKLLRPLFNVLYTDGLACGEDAGKWMFGASPFTVIHNGKDFQKFHFDQTLREQKRSEYGLQGKIVIGHVGMFNFQKNHEFLIQVFAEFLKMEPNAVLYLMGSGKLTEDVKKQSASLGLSDKVIFAGNVSDVAERLQAMDLMVFPSRFEGLPNVVLEWQAEGLPCLISDKITAECAPSDLVRFASIEDSPKIWGDIMKQMLSVYTNREEQAGKGTAALEQNGFDIEDSAHQLEEIYKKLV